MTYLWIQPSEMGDYQFTEYAEEAAKTASYLLWSMSGRKYQGETTVTERYTCVLRNNRLGPSIKTTSPILFGGDVYNIPSGDYDEYSELTSDGMSPESRIRLRGRPVTKIHAIRNRHGLILDPSSYYLVDHSTIHIKPGVAWTPCNTEITYSYGAPVPTAGKMAARKLAIEFARLWSGDSDCELPQRVTSVSRQGVSYTILDNQEFIDELRTGLYEIDLFLKVVNPDNARRRSKVFSPDEPRARRYTPKTAALTVNPEYDLTIVKGAPVSWSSTTPAVDLDVSTFFDASGYEPRLIIRNYSGTRSVTLNDVFTLTEGATDTLTFSIDYDSALSALGMVDPGTWTLYAVQPDPETGIENVSEMATGNLKIVMYS